jgi:hypothetical protein
VTQSKPRTWILGQVNYELSLKTLIKGIDFIRNNIFMKNNIIIIIIIIIMRSTFFFTVHSLTKTLCIEVVFFF